MLVAIVTPPLRPARLTISASCWWNLAFRTVWMIPARLSMRDSTSEASTFVVPTRTGWPRLFATSISRMTALYLSRRALKITSFLSTRMHGLFVGITCTVRR
jgi:hypothetical protein